MEGLQINILANIYNHIKRGVDLGRTLIMEQGSARSGKTYNTVEYLVLECVNNPIREREIVDPVTMKKMKVKEPLKISMSANLSRSSSVQSMRTSRRSCIAWDCGRTAT